MATSGCLGRLSFEYLTANGNLNFPRERERRKTNIEGKFLMVKSLVVSSLVAALKSHHIYYTHIIVFHEASEFSEARNGKNTAKKF